MMLLLLWWSSLVSVLILNFSLFHVNSFDTSVQFSCHEDEKLALLQFKHSFVADQSTCRYEGDYPKASSWEAEGGSSNCCLWDGVECDEETGHVIGVNLSGGCIYGSINSKSTLFHLAHLRKLNLAFNHFNHSSIPTAVGQLSEVMYLNLSSSSFFGPVPSEISRLSKLSTLDLSLNYDNFTQERFLKLKSSNLRGLVRNLSCLEILRLSYVDVPSEILDSLANLSSLTDLRLGYTGLYGSIPSSLSKLSQLTRLDLYYNHLSGKIPSSLQNLTQLIGLRVYGNQISGPIPSWCGNLTNLHALVFADNIFYGPIPQSLFKLNNLEKLYLNRNHLDGTLEFDTFLKMKRLFQLSLSFNKLSIIFEARNVNETTLPKFKILGLSSCNIGEFPDFLRHQNELQWLDLVNNSIRGHIPEWTWNRSVEALHWANISNNFVTDIQKLPTILPWPHLIVLKLDSNMLQGSLPIPPSSTEHLSLSSNMLSGEISPLICNLSSIRVLDLSNNNFSGPIPHCLGSSSSSLIALNLRNNSFHGVIWPLSFDNGSSLRMIDISHNQFQGKLPRSLANCMTLEYIDFSNNKLIDTFPTWLGTLPGLKVLFLQKNGFHGVIRRTKNTIEFPYLHIIDISYNSFIGALPSEYLFIWNGVKAFEMRNSTYMHAREPFTGSHHDVFLFHYNYTANLIIKSVQTYFERIRDELAVIDLSCNGFSGEIPEFNGNLVVLRSLNLSNNMLTGRIPFSVGNLSQLESLDLSRNMLSGEIPQQLRQLNFLESFNVSHNNLTGQIPHGSQLDTFDPSSFEGNSGLCGDPLPIKCGDSKALPLSPSADEKDDDSGSLIKLDWKFVLAGAISGFVVGVALGDMVILER